MGLTVRALAVKARARASREAKFLRDDIAKVTGSPRRAGVIAWAGGLTISGSLAAWQPVIGGVVLGVFLVVHGLFFIDVDAEGNKRGRRGV